jgi:probable blue pigment (indigoidine) exporter
MDFRAVGMGLAFAFMWSSAFTSARMIVLDAPPMTALALRFAISGAIALLLARALGESFRLTPAQWRATILFGVMQNAAYLGLNFVAMQHIEASLAAIIASSLPLIVALAGRVVFGERIRPLGIIGLFAGFAGVLLIMGTRLGGGADAFGVMLCILAACGLAVATLSLRGAAAGGGNLLAVVGFQMAVGSAVMAVFAFGLEWTRAGAIEVNWSWRLLLAFTYTTLVPGLLATWVWFRLVGRIGAVKAATYHFLNPFFGILVAAILLGERIGLTDVVGVVIVALGILAVQRSRAVAVPSSPPN